MKLCAYALMMICLVPGCFVYTDDPYPVDPDPTINSFGFYWFFELPNGDITDSCSLADVARVDVLVYYDGDLEYAVYDRPCGDMGLDLYDFFRGWYEIQLIAYCPLGVATHEALYESVWIDRGHNELGDLVLDYLGPCS